MKSVIKLSDINISDLKEIFLIADDIHNKGAALDGKTVVLFFPSSSIRTRITFEKGIHLLGGQSVLFPSDTLDKKESIKDVAGYLGNWADLIITRHNSLQLLEELEKHSSVPIINAMTSENHPCEIISDLYSISKLRTNFLNLQYTFVGKRGNIGNTWFEAARLYGFEFRQCCPDGRDYEIKGATVVRELDEAMRGSDVILTDSLPADALSDYHPYQITLHALKLANDNALLNPCPPFFCGEEVSEDAINSRYFVGYEFKKSLLEVQQALMLFALAK